jgi:uncharacterized membrane protein YbhN (UPF0104 family)
MSTLDATTAFPVSPSTRWAAGAWQARVRRLAVPGMVAGAALAIAFAIGGPGRALTDALGRAFSADPRWVAAAFAFEILSFAGYSLLLWHVAGRGASRLGLRESTQVSLAGAAATRLLPTAGVGGAALTLWTLRRAGHPGRAGMRTLLTFLVLLYAVFLGAIVVAGTLVATGTVDGQGPLALSAVPAGVAATCIAIALTLGLRHPGAPLVEAVTATRADRADRVRRAAGVLSEAVREAIVLLRGADPRLLGALAWWAFDVAVLWSAFHAFGVAPPLGVLVLAYFVGQVANTIPLPGAVSGGTVGVLLAFGVEGDLALAAVLAYRAIAIWVPGTAGTIAMAGLRSTVARWSREDAGDVVAPPRTLTGHGPDRAGRFAPEAVAA